MKASRSAAHLCMDVPPPLRAFTEAVTSLGCAAQPLARCLTAHEAPARLLLLHACLPRSHLHG